MIDVQFALKWVQKNIRRFGGNPNQVIIAGESCGSMGVNMLLMGPWSDGIRKCKIWLSYFSNHTIIQVISHSKQMKK